MIPVADVIPPRRRPYVTLTLIAASAVVFAAELQPGHGALVLARFFVHDGWLHFGGNMLYLWLFGPTIEDALGHGAYAAFCAAAAALAGAAHAALQQPASPLVGSSGTVAAILGAYFVLYPRSQVLTAAFLLVSFDVVEVPAVLFLGFWVLLQLATGLGTLSGTGQLAPAVFATQGAAALAGVCTGVLARRRSRRWD